MRFIGKLNDEWLENILEESFSKTKWIKAAVAYANGTPLLFKWCRDKCLKLEFWGRYDSSIPVSIDVLRSFLDCKSLNYQCKLLTEEFHAKTIWWGGYGAYIGSANLSNSAWSTNIENGLFLSEDEMMKNGILEQLEEFFRKVDKNSTALSREIFNQLVEHQEKIDETRQIKYDLEKSFEKSRKIFRKKELDRNQGNEVDKEEKEFLEEWESTLEILRKIARRVSENRPKWINDGVLEGVQADRFIHCFYEYKVKKGNKSLHEQYYEINNENPEGALQEALAWWKQFEIAQEEPEYEMTYEWAPFLNQILTKSKLEALDLEGFIDICRRVHAIRGHAWQVKNEILHWPSNEPKTLEKSIEIFANYLWTEGISQEGKSVKDLLIYLLHGGSSDLISKRLWEVTHSARWQIRHLGISGLGEIIGWAYPDIYPPRNNRTNKCLRALGNNVEDKFADAE